MPSCPRRGSPGRRGKPDEPSEVIRQAHPVTPVPAGVYGPFPDIPSGDPTNLHGPSLLSHHPALPVTVPRLPLHLFMTNTCSPPLFPDLLGKNDGGGNLTHEPTTQIDKNSDPAIEGYAMKEAPGGHSCPSPLIRTYGTLWCGYETMHEAWSQLAHTWSANPDVASPSKTTYATRRCKSTLLQDFPVDLLVVERGDITAPPPAATAGPSHWELLITHCTPAQRPTVVIETWQGRASLWPEGPSGKATVKRWSILGYITRCRVIQASAIGGAINQERLVVVRLLPIMDTVWSWPSLHPAGLPRAMGNLLTPPGLLPPGTFTRKLPPHVNHTSDPQLDCMPCGDWTTDGPWLRTERGFRRLLPLEIARGLGIPKHRLSQDPIDRRHLLRTTSVFHWEYLGGGIRGLEPQVITDQRPQDIQGSLEQDIQRQLDDQRQSTPESPTAPKFLWELPDLRENGTWYNARVVSLIAACQQYPAPKASDMIEHGYACLRDHRGNYDEVGARPTRLRILWWEFPREHWDELRDGSRMHFLQDPVSCIHPNSAMTPDQAKVGGAFLDELYALGIAAEQPADDPVLTTAPLFCVPKPHQVDEWRVIANMKEGGQNKCVGTDPVYLNRPTHILEQMYAGGWTAVVDASKFFYQFLTHPDDRKFLGILHPITQVLYAYHGLPMGGGNSPSLAGRYGLAFLRLLREENMIFQGTAQANCWWTGLRTEEYDPRLGYGLILVGEDGEPAVRLWVHVDDFCIHGPTYESTCKALRLFLDLSVRVGMLCHPGKLQPPAQIQLYTGFYFDTRDIPTLRVPTSKREKALAMVEHLQAGRDDQEYSRLALSVVAGTLESLVDATPGRIGHTYLRRLHEIVHPPGYDTGAAVYYTRSPLSSQIKHDLKWWALLLGKDISRPSRALRSGVLVPTWGDGSGTGTGGTIQLPGQSLSMWMGQWCPYVFRESSNWKELKTLLLTLQAIRDTQADTVRHSTLFYFTDNSTTYWVCNSGSSRSPGLHALVEHIGLIKLELSLELQVIHVPGTVMIEQGTDGLSRGVWASSLHPQVNQRMLTASVFDPMTYDPALVGRIHLAYGLVMNPQGEFPGAPSPRWNYIPWHRVRPGPDILHQHTVWCPPPELARQCLIQFLETWVESPLDTSGLFFVPRIAMSFWHGLSRHIQELCLIPAQDLLYPPRLPIPVLVLYVAPHVRSLKPLRPDRLDPPATFAEIRRHREEAELMRGLSPAQLSRPGPP